MNMRIVVEDTRLKMATLREEDVKYVRDGFGTRTNGGISSRYCDRYNLNFRRAYSMTTLIRLVASSS